MDAFWQCRENDGTIAFHQEDGEPTGELRIVDLASPRAYTVVGLRDLASLLWQVGLRIVPYPPSQPPGEEQHHQHQQEQPADA